VMAARWDQRVCLAAAFLIADRVSADRSSVDVLEVPETEIENQGQKVELICSVGGEGSRLNTPKSKATRTRSETVMTSVPS
jgi:hypothetical protein